MEKLPINKKPSHKTSSTPADNNQNRRYSNNHLPIIPQTITVKNDPSRKNQISSLTPREKLQMMEDLKENKEEIDEKPEDKDIEELDRKASPKNILDQQLNINMSIPPERTPDEEGIANKVPKPLTLNRPSNHIRSNSGVTKKIIKKKYPSDESVRANKVNFRNIKIRTLLLDYLGSKEHRKSLKMDLRNLGSLNLVTLKRNYVMVLGDLIQLVGLTFAFISFVTGNFNNIFYAVFFSDFVQLGLLVSRIGVKKKEVNPMSIMMNFGELDYGFGCVELCMTLLVLSKDVLLYLSLKQDNNIFFFVSLGLWLSCLIVRFFSLKFDSYFSTTIYTYFMFSIQFYLICAKVKFESSGSFNIFFIPFYVYLVFPGLIYLIMLIIGIAVMFQRKEEGEFDNKRILGFFAVLQSLEFTLCYILIFLFKDLDSNEGTLKWFFYVSIAIKALLFYMNLRYTEDFIFGLYFLLEKIKEDLTQPRFEVNRITQFQPFVKMIKFPGSNVMHFDPSDELVQKYEQEIANLDVKTSNEPEEEADFLGGIWKKDLCGICYRSKSNAVFLPCKHCEVCSSCAVRSTKFNGLCPFCRDVLRIFFNFFFRKLKKFCVIEEGIVLVNLFMMNMMSSLNS